jgi:hypothetical protein
MFLLALVFSCVASSLPSICGLKGGIKQSVHKIPANALKLSKEDRVHLHTSMQSQDQAHASMQSQDREQDPQLSTCHINRISHVALAIALLPLLYRGFLEQLRALECTDYDRAHMGLRSSTPLTWQHIKFCL